MTKIAPICYINSTFRCNHECSFCVSDETVHARHNSFSKDISIEMLEAFIRKVPSNVQLAHLSGGEPLLHKKLPAILQILSRRFSKIQIATNGVVLANPQFVDTILSICSPQFIIPILTTSPCTHRDLTKKNTWQTIMSGLKNISYKRAQNDGVELSIKMILIKSVLHELPDIPTLLRNFDIHVDNYILSGLCRTNGAIDSGLVPSFPETKFAINGVMEELISSGLPFCIHRIPLCAMHEKFWPYVMTIKEEDRSIERAVAISLYPSGIQKEIQPHKLQAEPCKQCDLVQYCEVASGRNAHRFDYNKEFTPIDLSLNYSGA
ncbi:MAG: radical SAM protein [Desulfococcaceae bacterium]